MAAIHKVHMRYAGDGFWELRVINTMRTVNRTDDELNARERIAADAIRKLADSDGTMTSAVSFMDFI